MKNAKQRGARPVVRVPASGRPEEASLGMKKNIYCIINLDHNDVNSNFHEVDPDDDEEMKKAAAEFYGYLVTYFRDVKKMYDEGIKQKEIFEQILGISLTSIE